MVLQRGTNMYFCAENTRSEAIQRANEIEDCFNIASLSFFSPIYLELIVFRSDIKDNEKEKNNINYDEKHLVQK